MKLLLVIALALCGCVNQDVRYFGKLGIGTQINEHTDQLLQSKQPYQCDKNLKAKVEVGVEKDDWEISLEHHSWWLCGTYNDDPELYELNLWLSKRFWWIP